jgi:predicted RNA-binding Zn-ribbon protein involved in translation (DUF1610 family)
VIVRLLLVLLLALLLARFLVLLGRHAVAAYRAAATPPVPPATVPLVPCGRCGVMVPRSRAQRGAGDAYLCRSCGGG